MKAAIAAGHPATVEAGAEILAEDGTAADAVVAASLASCVAETIMTGFLGGGHAVYFDAATGSGRNLDCFVAAPGLGLARRETELVHLEVPFGPELVHYSVGIASCGVPGLPAGLDELWRAHGRLPWSRLVEPALRLARDGVELPPAHAACLAMLAPALTRNEGARIYSPGGKLLEAGARIEQPGLARALELISKEGAASAYRGSIGESLLALMDEREGLVTRDDLDVYRAEWVEPVEVPYRGLRFLTRRGLSRVPETVRHLPGLRGLSETERVLGLVPLLAAPPGGDGDTTNISVVDRDRNACVLTTSLGLGSGDFVPDLDMHLNSMLGEADLVRGRLQPGERMGSMMAPSVLLDDLGELVLAAGAAGGTRLRTALLGVVAGMVDERLTAQDAISRPRFHPAGSTLNAEPEVDENALVSLEEAGWKVRRWPGPHHYFGGVSVVTSTDAAGDPRRNGGAAVLDPR
jgi:gamma-glutamyltranspeptidase/glutathione hydrolase